MAIIFVGKTGAVLAYVFSSILSVRRIRVEIRVTVRNGIPKVQLYGTALYRQGFG